MKEVTDLDVAKKLVYTTQSAASRGYEFTLSFAELRKIMMTKKCFFTGQILDDIDKSPHQRTLDRLDNNKGYVSGNVVACSSAFNKLKGCLTIKDIKTMYKGLKKKKLV